MGASLNSYAVTTIFCFLQQNIEVRVIFLVKNKKAFALHAGAQFATD